MRTRDLHALTFLHVRSVTWLRHYVPTPATEFRLTNQNETRTYGIPRDFTETDIIFFCNDLT